MSLCIGSPQSIRATKAIGKGAEPANGRDQWASQIDL